METCLCPHSVPLFLFKRQTELKGLAEFSGTLTKYQWSFSRLRCMLEKRYKELSSAVLAFFFLILSC